MPSAAANRSRQINSGVCTKGSCFDKGNGNGSIAAENVLLRRRCAPFRRATLPSNNATDQILLRRRRGLLRTNTRSMTLVLGSVARLGGARLFRSKI